LAWGREAQFPSINQFSPLWWLLKCGITAPKTPKLLIFGINFGPEGYFPLAIVLYKIWRGGGRPGPHCHPNFQHCGFKNVGLRRPKSPKIAILAPNKNQEGPYIYLNIGAQLETFLYATVQ